MKIRKYICESCSGVVNDSSKFCSHCGSKFDGTILDDTSGIEEGETVIDDEGNEYTVLEVGEDYWVLSGEGETELTVEEEDFGEFTKPLDIEDGTVAFSINKGEVSEVKKQILEVDPKASFSTFVPLSKQMEGIFVKTSKDADIESLLNENKINIVKGNKMGYASM
jgi:hypothetical protein